MSKADLLRHAAARAAGRPFFMATLLREYEELHGMDDEQLASELGCPVADLPRLALCRRPDARPGRFRADVERIAAHFGLSPTALARLVRETDAARQLRRAAPAGESDGLLAARDREPPIPEASADPDKKE